MPLQYPLQCALFKTQIWSYNKRLIINHVEKSQHMSPNHVVVRVITKANGICKVTELGQVFLRIDPILKLP